MTDNLPPGDNGTGDGGEGAAQPQPWFPPAGDPGAYGQPPPFDPGQASSRGATASRRPATASPGYGQPGG